MMTEDEKCDEIEAQIKRVDQLLEAGATMEQVGNLNKLFYEWLWAEGN